MVGCHHHMGNVWLPDKAVSRYVIGGCFYLLEKDWNNIWEEDKEDLHGLRRVCDYHRILWKFTRRKD